MRNELFGILGILGLLLTLTLTASAQTTADVKQESSVAHQHSARFLQLVNESRKRVRETNVEDVKAQMDRGEKIILVDVREESEFARDHLPGAIHLGKGVIERDIEDKVPDLNAPLVLYWAGVSLGACCRQLAENGLQERALDGWRHPCLAGERIPSHEITHGREKGPQGTRRQRSNG